jgi:hypothetical protein
MTFALAGSTAPALAKNPTSDATASTTVVQTCSWDRPGHDPFMGDVVAAIDRYQDIPVEVRERLKARMVKREYDDIVTIRRDTIEGKARYGGVIRDMHFGDHQVCRTVTRSAWSPKMQERGLVYCDGGTCILVPTVCRNVSRIARAQVAHETAEGDVPPLGIVPTVPEEAVPVVLAGLPGMALPPVPGTSPGDAGRSFATGAAPGGWGGGGGSGGGGGGGGGVSGGGGGSGESLPPSGGLQGAVLPIGSTEFSVLADIPASELPVGISPVPEPETWALMLGGLAMLSALSRRCQRTVNPR